MPTFPLPSAPLPVAALSMEGAHATAFQTQSARAQPLLPLNGVTILVVEDSRFACEALRLMSMRSGARLRRAETLKDARAHLRVYRPDVVIVDLGLPDGRGEDLIQELASTSQRPKALLATSGDAQGESSAASAGADAFLEKPLENLAKICQIIQQLLPDQTGTSLADAPLTPDPLALHDDLVHAAHSLDSDPAARVYVTAFLRGVAEHAHDEDLWHAADAAALSQSNLLTLRKLVLRRLETAKSPFSAQD